MKLTRLEEDLRIHQKLEDEPNDVGGLSAQALKEKFDQAGLTIQGYLNEVHLPEEEQAVAGALEEARRYTDEKVVELGRGDMAAAVYDTKKRRKDVYDYTDEKVKELKADRGRGVSVFVGTSDVRSKDSETAVDSFTSMVDPKGLWSEEEKAFIVPEGAVAAVVTARVLWMRQLYSVNYITVEVNGQRVNSSMGPDNTNGAFTAGTEMVAVPVKGGDRVTVRLVCERERSNYTSEVRMNTLRVECLM